MEPRVVNIEGIEEGMLAADDVPAFDGAIIVRKGAEIEGRHITLMKRAVISKVRVIIPEKPDPLRDKYHIDDYPTNLAYLKAARILVVDDSKFLRFKLVKLLTETGLNVVGEATNGKEAVEQAVLLNPTVVTMDIEMPNHDGLSAIQPLLKALPGVIVIMISSLGEEDKILEALAKGACDFIVKPIDPQKTAKSIINTIVACGRLG